MTRTLAKNRLTYAGVFGANDPSAPDYEQEDLQLKDKMQALYDQIEALFEQVRTAAAEAKEGFSFDEFDGRRAKANVADGVQAIQQLLLQLASKADELDRMEETLESYQKSTHFPWAALAKGLSKLSDELKTRVEGYTRDGPNGPITVGGYERDESSGAVGARLDQRLEADEADMARLHAAVNDLGNRVDANPGQVNPTERVPLSAELLRLQSSFDQMLLDLRKLLRKNPDAGEQMQARIAEHLTQIDIVRAKLDDLIGVSKSARRRRMRRKSDTTLSDEDITRFEDLSIAAGQTWIVAVDSALPRLHAAMRAVYRANPEERDLIQRVADDYGVPPPWGKSAKSDPPGAHKHYR